MVIVVFRSRLRSEHEAEFHALADEMMKLAVAMPGFVSYKVFAADDGERCSIIEFESHEHLKAWREHPAHRAAQRKGRELHYAEYTLQVADPVRESRFRR
jgi:heme-degrading monooxygenase HmoA